MEFEKIQEIICEVMGVEADAISMETSFSELNADSLDLMQIVLAAEDVFGITIPEDKVEDIVTVGDAVEQIRAAAQGE